MVVFSLCMVAHHIRYGRTPYTVWWTALILACITMDVCTVPASSVPCEHIFSGGGQTATDRHSQLGAKWFEQLQILKFWWWSSVIDRIAAVTDKVLLDEYVELLQLDTVMSEDDCNEVDVVIDWVLCHVLAIQCIYKCALPLGNWFEKDRLQSVQSQSFFLWYNEATATLEVLLVTRPQLWSSFKKVQSWSDCGLFAVLQLDF